MKDDLQVPAKDKPVTKWLLDNNFDNLLDAQPEVKYRLYELWGEKKSLRSIKMTLEEEFPNARVPSIPNLSKYVKNKLVGQPMNSRLPLYADRVMRTDGMAKLYDSVDNLQELVDKAKAGNAKLETKRRMIDSLITACLKLLDAEGRMGIRHWQMPNVTLNQQNNVINTGDTINGASDEPVTLDRLIELKRQLELDQQSGEVVRDDIIDAEPV